MNESNNNEIIDGDWDYDLSIWVSTEKSLEQFEKSLSDIIEPLTIEDHCFDLGKIHCEIEEVSTQPKNYEGVPVQEYKFKVIVPTVTYLIWDLFDKRFAFSLTLGMRTKFACRYLVTNDDDNFIMYSGANLPVYFNSNYPLWLSGELKPFRGSDAIELRI